MTRIPFDQLAKQYLEDCLEPLGTVQRQLEVPGEPTFVDLWFTPNPTPAVTPPNLGLLSRIVTTPCLLEPFRAAPSRREVRNCLLKLLWVHADRHRKSDSQPSAQSPADLPHLWILAATTTRPVIADFGGQEHTDWDAGVYLTPQGYRTAIVAIDQLPTTPETLWLRILGRDRTQQQAIQELLALPATDPLRSRVLQLLVNWRITLELRQDLELEERSLMATLSQAYLEWEQQTRQQGIEQGCEQGEKRIILRLLTRRFGEVPDSLRSQIDTLTQLQLEALSDVLLDFAGLDDLATWLQTHTN